MPLPVTRAGLDQHPVASAGQLLDADGDHRHAIFVRLDFLGNADDIFIAC